MFAKTLSAAILIICFFIACEKSAYKQTNLKGKWRLTESFIDPGNGSGQWNPVNPATPNQVIEFKQGGKFSGGQVMILHNYDQWVATSDSTITLTTSAYSVNNMIYSNYKIVNDELLMSLGCIEACMLKFEKVK